MKSRKSNVLKSLKMVFIYLILLIFLPGLGLSQDSYTTAGFDFNGDCEINLPDAVIGLKILVGMDDVALSGEKEIGMEKIIALLQNMSGIRNIHCPTQDFIPCGFEDNYEDDDRFFQARTIALDNEEPQHHTFHDKGDEDWVIFYGISGQIYEIQAKIESLGSGCDIVIEIYDEASLVTGTPITSKDYAGAGKDETLRWEDCPADAVYYVKLKNSDPNVFGENIKYDLKINLPSAPLPGHIIGYVYDKNTGQKITGSVIRTSAGRSAISNYCNCNFYCARDYCIYFHPAGTYTLTAAAPGYKTVSVSITVKETVATAQDIVMSRTR